MAINSRNERACCVCLALPAGGVFPSPDATVDGADRQHIARAWRSISAAATSPGPLLSLRWAIAVARRDALAIAPYPALVIST